MLCHMTACAHQRSNDPIIYRIAVNFCGTVCIFRSRVIDKGIKFRRKASNEASVQLKMMLSSEFPHTKLSLLIDHPRKP